MKRIGNVYDKIISYDNLVEAHRRAKKDKADYKEVKMVESNPEYYLKNLQFVLANEFYYVNSSDYRLMIIKDKGKEREIWKLSYYPHRIVQWAIMLQIQDRFLKSFIYDTYSSIENRGLHLCVKRIKKILFKDKENTEFCLKLDMKKYYPSIDNTILYELVERKVKDKKLLRLLKIIIFSMGAKGQPIGSLWSQWAGNLYLSELDHYVKEKLKVKYFFRFCDDIVILGKSKEELRDIFYKIKSFVEEKLNLTIKENYQIFPARVRGVDFLGYRFFGDFTLLRKRNLNNMKKVVKRLSSKDVLTYSEFCSINSYTGMLMHCDSYRLFNKYLSQFNNKKFINVKGEVETLYVCYRQSK